MSFPDTLSLEKRVTDTKLALRRLMLAKCRRVFNGPEKDMCAVTIRAHFFTLTFSDSFLLGYMLLYIHM